jgi:hypothetical protein
MKSNNSNVNVIVTNTIREFLCEIGFNMDKFKVNSISSEICSSDIKEFLIVFLNDCKDFRYDYSLSINAMFSMSDLLNPVTFNVKLI